MRILFLCALAACATTTESVTLTVEGVVPPPNGQYVYAKAQELSDTNAHPKHFAQTYSLLGREDLIQPSHQDYRAKPCPAASIDGDVIGEIVRQAEDTRVVIINESHSRSETRRLTATVAEALAPLGYTLFGAETFGSTRAAQLAAQSDEPFVRDGDGYYLKEAQFGRMLRRVKAAGYDLVPYERTPDQAAASGAPVMDRIAAREAGQASNVTDLLTANPQTKILLHVGYDHAREAPAPFGDAEVSWFALRLKERTGIDPLTVSQTTCSGGDGGLVGEPSAVPDGTFDLYVDLPPAQFVRGRPAWRMEDGDIATDIPSALLLTDAPHVVEARLVGEPDEAVPMDRVFVRPGEDVALMLPPGAYRVRAVRIEATIDDQSGS